MDRDILVTGGRPSAPVKWQTACGWVSLFSGLCVLAMTASALLIHWAGNPLLLNTLILTSVSTALLNQESRRALLGFTLAAGAFLTELFLVLMHAITALH